MQWHIDLDSMPLIWFGEAELRRRAFPSWSLGTSKMSQVGTITTLSAIDFGRAGVPRQFPARSQAWG